MEFVWDERKNQINKRKHGISFEIAALVFEDPYHLTRQDREVEGEPRWQTIGIVNDGWPTQARFWLEWGSSTAE